MGPYIYRNYVHIKFKPKDSKASWYWAQKIKDGMYKRLAKDGDSEMHSEIRKDGTIVVTEELLIGVPIEERQARMNLHYAELEEYDADKKE